MKKEQFSIIEHGEILEDLSLSMVLGGAVDKDLIGMDCSYCNTCGNNGNNSNNSSETEMEVTVG